MSEEPTNPDTPPAPFFRTRDFWLRTVAFAVAAYVVFGWLCMPISIHGEDMAPAHKPGKLTFCWRPRFWFSDPQPGDIVFVRIPGTKVMLLRRVIARGGDTVGFFHGTAVVNGKAIREPYVETPCTWHFPPSPVSNNCVFVIGDKRDLPAEEAGFGPVDAKQVVGAPLW